MWVIICPKGEGRGEGERGHRTVAADPNTSGTLPTEPQILVALPGDGRTPTCCLSSGSLPAPAYLEAEEVAAAGAAV